jgi:hypothetical protein
MAMLAKAETAFASMLTVIILHKKYYENCLDHTQPGGISFNCWLRYLHAIS